MINTNDVIDFIEEENGIKLRDTQKRFLHNLVQGKRTRTPRGFGKSMLITGYCDYLKCILDDGRGVSSKGNRYMKYIDPRYENWDDSIYLDEVLEEKPCLLNVKSLDRASNENPKIFEREYNSRDIELSKDEIVFLAHEMERQYNREELSKLQKEFTALSFKYDCKNSLIRVCQKHDIYYDNCLLENIKNIQEVNRDNFFRYYMKYLNLHQYKDKKFSDSKF